MNLRKKFGTNPSTIF